jgi:hypothetical protein
VLSSGKNKSSFFNGLQAKLTGSNPVALTTFLQTNCGSKYNNLANNSLKKFPNFKQLFLKRIYLISNKSLKNSSKIDVFSPKINLVLQVMNLSVAG